MNQDKLLALDGIQPMIRRMVESSGKSLRQVSEEIGRSSNYLSSMFRNGTMPSAALLADIAEACGYAIAVIGEKEAYTISSWEFSPPTDDDEEANYANCPWWMVTRELEKTGRNVVTVVGPAKFERND